MAYKVIILYQLYMPSYFLGTFTEYPYLKVTAVLKAARGSGVKLTAVTLVTEKIWHTVKKFSPSGQASY